jgi:TolB protein
VRRLTKEPTNSQVVEDRPVWSRDGVRIAWVRRELGKSSRILFADLSTGAHGEIRGPGTGDLDDPTWSPDGRNIAFSVMQGDSAQIYRSALDGGVATPVTRGAGPNWAPVWLP